MDKLGTTRTIVKEGNPKPSSSVATILIVFVTEQILESARAKGEPIRKKNMTVKCGNAGELVLLVFAALLPIVNPGQTRCLF